MSDSFDAAIIGAGPGGYVCAIRLGQLGLKAVVIEKGELGGVCLNWGCIPSKAVIHAAHLREEVKHAAKFGIGTGEVPFDLEKLRAWKNGILKKLRGGIAQLLEANGVEHIKGTAKLTGPNSIECTASDGGTSAQHPRTISARSIVIGTGARPFELPFLPRSHPRVWTSEECLELDEIPERFALVGGGVIGLEIAGSHAKLGSKVTIIELMPQIMTGTDADLVKPVLRKLKKLGIKLHLESKAVGIEDGPDGAVLKCEGKKGAFDVPCDKVLVAIGFRPNTEGIGLDAAGVETTDRGFVPTDPRCRTNVPHIYAIGDVTGGPFLAHRASKQGIVCAEVIAGKPSLCDFQAMPMGAFCDPEVATVGLSEVEAREAGHDVHVGTFPYAALGRSMVQEATEGLVKVIGDKKSGLLLGVGLSGARANDLIAEAALAIEMGAQVEDLALTVHAHPTFAEALMEASEDFLGHAIHISRKSPR